MTKTDTRKPSAKYRPYPEYKDSGIEWFGKIPTDWQCLAIRTSVQAPVIKGSGRELPFLALEHIVSIDGGLINGFEWETKPADECAIFQVGDVLFGKLRPYLRKYYYAQNSGCCSTELLVLHPYRHIVNKYLYYLVQSEYFVSLAEATSYGVKMPRTSWESLRTQYVPLPKLQEQEKLIAFLDRETTKITTLIHKKEKLIELLKEKRQAIITQAVTKGLDPKAPLKNSGIPWLGKIPRHWAVGQTKFFYSIQLGKMLQNQSDTPDDVQVKYLKALHVGWEKVATDDLPEMWASPNDIQKYEVKKGDLLVCEGGEAGRAAMLENVPSPCIIQNALHRVRGSETVRLKYLMYLLESMSRAAWFDVICNKATIAHFTGEKLGEAIIPMPSADEQKAIIAHIEAGIGRVDKLIQKNLQFIELLKEKRQALISAAVTGKIDVRGDSYA